MTRARALALALLAALAACSSTQPDYHHNRWDYWSFRARTGALPEPNYLPWAMHRETVPGAGQSDVLVACRWPDAAFPLPVYVAPPAIPESVAGEFPAHTPADYVAAVDEAFELWAKAIGRPVRFKRVDSAADAQITVKLLAEIQEIDKGQVLGVVHAEADRCTVKAPGATHDRVEIGFAPHEASVFVVDRDGLLTPRQVRAVALHEIGHLLGVSGQHSPLAGDVMYEAAGDRPIEMLSEHDKNTLRALYSIPPGTVYARLSELHARPVGEVRRDPPKLGEPTRDDRYGFEVRFPKDWQVIRTPNGWIAVDGVSWDYDASVQVVASRGSVGSHLSLISGQELARGDDVRSEGFELDGAPVSRLIARGSERSEQTDVVEWGEGWVLLVMADARAQDFEFYRPWFQRVLLSVARIEAELSPKGAR
jgi:predicted Zn-dependent protease